MEDELMAEKLHELYLEATKELNPKSYNPNAQKAYKDLTEEQKFIDRYIAQAILTLIRKREIDARIDEVDKLKFDEDDVYFPYGEIYMTTIQDAYNERISILEQQLKEVDNVRSV